MALHDLSNGASRQLWEIRLLWSRKPEVKHLYWSDDVSLVNERAVGLWPQLASTFPCSGGMSGLGCEDNVDGSQTPQGMPYRGFATLAYGQGAVTVEVARVDFLRTRRLDAQLVKRALASRGISTKEGSQEDLARRLADYILYPCETSAPQTKWRCRWREGLDIRVELDFNAPRHHTRGPRMNETVCASEERVNSEGIRFLRLADGRGWLPTADPCGRMLLIREDAKRIRLKIEEPWQWSMGGLGPMMCSVRSWIVVEAFVKAANGEKRELLSFPRCPPEQSQVKGMEFPITLTLVEASSAPSQLRKSPQEAPATPAKKPPTHKHATSEKKRIYVNAESELLALQPRRRLRQKTTALT